MDDFPLTPAESSLVDKIKMVIAEIRDLDKKISDPARVLKNIKTLKLQRRIMVERWIVLNAAHIVKFGFQFPKNLPLSG